MVGLLSHRGPDGRGFWISDAGSAGFGHARLAVMDTSAAGAQPMTSPRGPTVVFNGMIYNYEEIRTSASRAGRKFRSSCDTESILAAYEAFGLDFVKHLRGMFAIGLWDEERKELILARDRFGIKPLYYTVENETLYFASEVKALLPFVSNIETGRAALEEYLTFQTQLGSETMFQGVHQVMPGEIIVVRNGQLVRTQYWEIKYEVNYQKPEAEFVEELQELFENSMELHLKSDVEVGTYLSGGIDSSLITSLASSHQSRQLKAFHGRYLEFPGYDESGFAQAAADNSNVELHIKDLDSSNVLSHLRKVIYHLDYPVAGPGSLPQFLISAEAAQKVKVVLGGQGGDEIFGGYARYLIGYLEQALRAAIDGSSKNGNFVVTLESIVPNLGLLREYGPLLRKFWSQGLFGPMDERYFKLVSRQADLEDTVDWSVFDKDRIFESYLGVFNSPGSVSKEAYFDSMTHFDFKTLLPALLHVEDRMSMAHGLESRVPFLDHKIVEFAATIPADVKFKSGELKRMLKLAFSDRLPAKINERRDKMGFPVPIAEWSKGALGEEFTGLLESLRDRDLDFLNSKVLTSILSTAPKFSRGTWALLSLELWHEQFHDQAEVFNEMSSS